MARLTAAAGPPGGLAAAAALRWAAEAGLHPGAFLRVPDRPRRPLVHTPVVEGLGQFHRAAGPAATRSEPGLQLQGAVSHVAGSCYEWVRTAFQLEFSQRDAGEDSVNDETRAAWLDVARRVGHGERENLLCPVRRDDYLVIRWIPFQGEGGGGEYQLRCPKCGAENSLLIRSSAGGD